MYSEADPTARSAAHRCLFVVQLPGGGSAVGAVQVQQVEAGGLPGQWHREGGVAHGHGNLPHRAAQRIGQAQGVAGAGGANVSVAWSGAGLGCSAARAAACAARVSSRLTKPANEPQVSGVPTLRR